MQGQDVNARPKSQVARPLRHRRQKHVLRGSEAVNRRSVMLRQMVGVESSSVEPLDLLQPVVVNVVKRLTGDRFYVVENTKLQGHAGLLVY